MDKKSLLPRISVIIPVRAGDKTDDVLLALRQVKYPANLIELFISYGTSPSKQRNAASRRAKGEILYFLDGDSQVEKNAFKRAVAVFSGKIKPFVAPQQRGFSLFPDWLNKLIVRNFFSGRIFRGEIGVVGGPNIWSQTKPFLGFHARYDS